jgi:hypothetical protein
MKGNRILERIGVDRYEFYTIWKRVLQWVFARSFQKTASQPSTRDFH